MNRYSLSKAGICSSEGIARFGGKSEIYEKYLIEFPQDPCFSRMCEAIESRDAKAAFEAAHALKGIAGNLSMTRLYDDLFPLVEELRQGSLEKVDELLRTVKKDYSEAVAAID